jgi:hypothetical protein
MARRFAARRSAFVLKFGQRNLCGKKNGQHCKWHCAATAVAVKAIVKYFPPLRVFKQSKRLRPCPEIWPYYRIRIRKSF